MAQENNTPQEPRSERATVMVTPEEKRAIKLLAATRGIERDADVFESDVIREHLDWAAIMEEYQRKRVKLEEVA